MFQLYFCNYFTLFTSPYIFFFFVSISDKIVSISDSFVSIFDKVIFLELVNKVLYLTLGQKEEQHQGLEIRTLRKHVLLLYDSLGLTLRLVVWKCVGVVMLKLLTFGEQRTGGTKTLAIGLEEVVHAFNPSAQESEQVNLCEFEAGLGYRLSSRTSKATQKDSVSTPPSSLLL